MTHNHGGYDDAQLGAIVGSQAPNVEGGRAAFLALANNEDTPQTPEPKNGKPEKSNEPTSEAKKTVQFKSKKLRKFFSSIPELVLKTKGIEADEDDKELIDTATELLEEMFGVSFEVPDSMWVIRSRWLALLFPIGAVLIVYIKHILPDWIKAQQARAEENNPTQ
jgi:hypothetical protein